MTDKFDAPHGHSEQDVVRAEGKTGCPVCLRAALLDMTEANNQNASGAIGYKKENDELRAQLARQTAESEANSDEWRRFHNEQLSGALDRLDKAEAENAALKATIAEKDKVIEVTQGLFAEEASALKAQLADALNNPEGVWRGRWAQEAMRSGECLKERDEARRQLAEAQSDASCAKFDMETYKTRAVNAEHLLSTQTEALKALRDASAKEQRVANNLALAYTSGWYSCPDVPPHEHRDICGKCLECLTSDVPALATPEPAKCELCGPDKDGAHPGDCPNFPTKSFQRSIGAVPTICGECRGECRGHQAPAKSAEPCAHPVTELSSDGKYERCAYGCHLEWLRECAPPTPPEKEERP